MSIKVGSKNFIKLKNKLSDPNLKNDLIEDCLKTLGAVLLKEVKENTPVIQGRPNPGQPPGKLKMSWNLWKGGKITKKGKNYYITVINPVFYSFYVEYDRRQHPHQYVWRIEKRLVKNHVIGKKFLEKSVIKVARIAPAIIDKRIGKFMKRLMK